MAAIRVIISVTNNCKSTVRIQIRQFNIIIQSFDLDVNATHSVRITTAISPSPIEVIYNDMIQSVPALTDSRFDFETRIQDNTCVLVSSLRNPNNSCLKLRNTKAILEDN